VREGIVMCGEDDGGAMLERVGRVRRTGERGDSACVDALGCVGGRERAERRNKPLRDDEHAGPLRDLAAVRPEDGWQVACRDRETDEVMDRKLQLGGVAGSHAPWERHTGQVALVLARRAQRLRLLARAAAQLDVEASARERNRERRAPRACADDCSAAQRRDPAEPLPLQHHARPDAVGDRLREVARGGVDPREGERAASADAHLTRADAPAAANVGGADHGDRDDGHAGLQRKAADAALGRTGRSGPHARALGEDQHAVAAREDRLRRLDHVPVGVTAINREGAKRIEDPALEAVAEQLLLGDVVDRPPHHRADHERIEEAAVVGREDHRAVGRDVLAPDPREAEVQMEERLQDPADQPVHDRVHAALACPPMQSLEIHSALRTLGA